ncbi:MAG TPA: response regulator transcription factor [Actinocrinis sp.]|nr:response regulator transcription factor [Actinocrinis sp.]
MQIFVIESSPSTAERLVTALRRQGYAARSARLGHEALRSYQGADLILLDLGLPDMDGVEVCRSIRAAGRTPIICLNDQDNALDRVLALQAGADDCVARSCGEREILARIEAVMRRIVGREGGRPQVISWSALRIDNRAREVHLSDRAVKVTSKEFDLLYTLAASPETVVSRKELMATIWNDHWAGASRTIDIHVSSLRTKLGSPDWIITIRGVGYRMGYGRVPSESAGVAVGS